MSSLIPLAPRHTAASIFHPNPEIARFHDVLQSTVATWSLAEKNWAEQDWAEVAKLMTPSVMQHAFSQRNRIIEIFDLQKPVRPSIERLLQQIQLDPCLSQMEPGEAIERLSKGRPGSLEYQLRDRLRDPGCVVRKLKVMEKEQAQGMRPLYFKAFNNVLAFAIPCWNLSEFHSAISHIQRTAECFGGEICIEGETQKKPCQFVDRNGYFIDLVQPIQVYLPDIGLFEFRIAHPFACYKFSRDVELLEFPESTKPNLSSIYRTIGQYLLDEANGLFEQKPAHRIARQNVFLEEVEALYQDCEIEEELQYILSMICKRDVTSA